MDETLDLCKATVGKYPLADITRRVNAGMVRAFRLGYLITGDVSLDDESKTTPPLGYQSLTTGINAYARSGFSGTFTNIVKLESLDGNGNSRELTEENVTELDFVNTYNTSVVGQPSYFVKIGGTFYVRPTPNYTKVNGLIGFGNRKPDFFLSSDTTKEAPFWLPEFYLSRFAAQPYLQKNNMDNVNSNKQDILDDEKEIQNYFARINKNSRPRAAAAKEDNR